MDSQCFVDSNRHFVSNIVPLENNEKHESDLGEIESLNSNADQYWEMLLVNIASMTNILLRVVYIHFAWFEH